MKVLIRPEAISDIDTIRAVTKAAFLRAPHTDHTEHFIVDALRKADALFLSIVAELDATVVGHVAVSPVTISDNSVGWFGLGPISVIPELQRHGIGTLLMEEAIRQLVGRGAAGCVLVGDPAYYSRFGFESKPGLDYPDVPPEYFQAVVFGPTVPRGVVSYHEAFGAQG